MKNIITILIFGYASFSLAAQEITVGKGEKITEIKKGAYYKTSTEDLEKFTGKWTSEGNNLVVILTIKKIFFKGPDVYMDALAGNVYYNDSLYSHEDEKFSLIATTVNSKEGKAVSFLFKDILKNKNGNLRLKLLEEGKLKWTLENTEGIRVGGYDRSFSIPTTVILNKVE